MGRPKGVRNNELSLTPVYKFLKEQLETNVYFFMGDINEETKSKFAYLKEGEIILLENIRRGVVSNADQTPERAMVDRRGQDGGDFLFFPKK